MEALLVILVFLFYLALLVGIPCIFGAITKHINESKGYDGGFAWGFWLGWIGIIVVACKESLPTYRPRSSARFSGTNAQGRAVPPLVDSSAPVPAGGWRCTCGRTHAAYVSSCVCGVSKQAATMPQKAVSAESKNDTATTQKSETKTVSEQENLALLKEYKQLLDDGVITQEEFDAKKKQLLGL